MTLSVALSLSRSMFIVEQRNLGGALIMLGVDHVVSVSQES
jgi:uncharacterized MnhB-related membrane protein